MLRTRQIGDEINEACSGTRLWWLGGSGVAVRAGEVLALIDPVLSLWEGRSGISEIGRELIHEPPVPATGIEEADLVLITRADEYHLGPRTVMELTRTKAAYVCPRRDANALAGLGIESGRMRLAEPGGEMEIAGVRVISTEARMGRAGSGCGYVLEMGGKRVFHPGETTLGEEILGLEGIEVLMAPIGVAALGVGGCARLANALGARWVVPCHYWTYADDETWGVLDPRGLIEYVENGEDRVKILDQGEMFQIPD